MPRFCFPVRLLFPIGRAETRSFCRRYAASSTPSKSPDGYKSIGSFHSENLAELLQQDDTVYKAPELPFPEAATYGTGKLHGVLRREDFLIDFEKWTFLNHGAFGGALRVGYHRANDWRLHLERQPLRYFDRDLLPHLVYTARRLASFVNADPTTVALIPNVTAGLNAVFAHHTQKHQSAAHCVIWDTTYGSVKKMAERYFEGRVSTIPFQAEYLDDMSTHSDPSSAFTASLDKFLESVPAQQQEELLFVLDHTTSNTALTMPIETLAASIKDYFPRALVVVDGAHGLLAQPIDMSTVKKHVDIYVTNGHKWLAAPRGVAAMFVHHPIMAAEMLPAVQSHGVDETDLFTRFVWDGCRDYAAALAIPAVLDVWQDPPKVRQRCQEILSEGVGILARDWYGVGCALHDPVAGAGKPITLVPLDSLSTMALVRVPATPGERATSTDAKKLQDYLHRHYIEVPIKCINEHLYVRVSAHVYNRASDFEKLSQTCLDLWGRTR